MGIGKVRVDNFGSLGSNKEKLGKIREGFLKFHLKFAKKMLESFSEKIDCKFMSLWAISNISNMYSV